MASAKALVSIKRGGKRLPPGSILHGLTNDELRDLAGFVTVVSSDVAEAAPDGVEQPAEGDDAAGAPEGPHEPPEAPETAPEGPAEPRIVEIKAAIDLLDESDFTAAGRPKVAALSDVLGYKPTADEVTAALALRGEEGL